jgi:hypothetical protein
MGVEVLIPLLAIFSVLFIPIAGLTFIFASKFALKPLVETLAKALKESSALSSPEFLYRIQELTDSVESLQQEVRALKEGQEFDRKLLGSLDGEE